MLGNWRKKLNDAIQGGLVISESLQQQYLQRTSSTPVTPSSDEKLLAVSDLPPGINIFAGCELLAKYQDDWKNIHEANEINAQSADQIAVQIEEISQRTNAQHVDLRDLMVCMAGLPALVTKLQDSMQTLHEMKALSQRVENELQRLEDSCQECDLQEFMLQKQCELSQHKQRKMVELENYRRKIADEHEAKIRQHEQRLLRIQRERQAVFDDAFRNDLEEYKQTGVIPKMQKENSKDLVLEEVVLEDPSTKDALEEFLNG